jgi:hypothetical protein
MCSSSETDLISIYSISMLPPTHALPTIPITYDVAKPARTAATTTRIMVLAALATEPPKTTQKRKRDGYS